MALVKTAVKADIARRIAADYQTKTGIKATVFSSRPAAGATIIKG